MEALKNVLCAGEKALRDWHLVVNIYILKENTYNIVLRQRTFQCIKTYQNLKTDNFSLILTVTLWHSGVCLELPVFII